MFYPLLIGNQNFWHNHFSEHFYIGIYDVSVDIDTIEKQHLFVWKLFISLLF